MTKLDTVPEHATMSERALLLASQFGDNVRQIVPPHAGKWLDAGMKLGALKASTRVAGKFVRRNPAMLVAAAAGAGALWYLAKRRARQAEDGEAENGQSRSKRVAAKRGSGSRRRASATSR